MKEWATSFYHSSAWIRTSHMYKKSKHNLCERCGLPAKIVHHKIYLTPININDNSITLSWNNLEALCQDCHNKEHHREKVPQRYIYDKDGNILPPP